ncbi:MAG: hypothetical protein ABL889_20255, partial [Terricaulis sp.]
MTGFAASLVLYATKLFSSMPFARRWLQLWNPGLAEGWSSVVLTHYHRSIILEIFLESIPQILIQSYNNGSSWST